MDNDVQARLAAARAGMAAAGLDALLITPSSDLRYLTGYAALPLERLTCLVLPADGEPTLVVPRLERPAAEAATSLAMVDFGDGEDAYALAKAALAKQAGEPKTIGLANHMWAEQVLAFRETFPAAEQRLASEVVKALRMRKTAAEIDALREAGSAIDGVHARMGEWLRPGRTEAAVAADIAAGMREAGHALVDFVIVASGPNGASPHHEVSDRVIQPGDPVVVDIGGAMHSGYFSDCTRTYAVGEPPADFLAYYEVLRAAQQAAVAAVRPGVTAESVDAAARDLLTDAGYGEAFLHRTGHGIGLDVHEDPYIVTGNDLTLEPGMTFSIEPGVYLKGRHGSRIEDIVACTADGVERLNTRSTELVIL